MNGDQASKVNKNDELIQQNPELDPDQKDTSEQATPEHSSSNTNTVLNALYEKYGTPCDEPLEFKICVATSAPGLTDSGKLILPCIIGLNCLNINGAGDSRELSNLCQKVTELDLSHNNISDWAEVISLLQALQRLQFLNLSHNPLHLSPDLTAAQLSDIPDDVPLVKLALNRTQVSWPNLWTLLAKLKNLEELHLSVNGIDHVVPPDDDISYPKMRRVYLFENSISNVEDVLTVGHIFPRLQTLVLTDNPIENIDVEPAIIQQTFPCLEDVSLTNCKLSDWKAFEMLHNLPQLKRLRVLRIPLTEKYDKQLCRQLILGYLPNITHLNGTHIDVGEREDAERAFIRHYMDQSERPTRYEELHRIYGDLDPLVEIDLSPSETVTVTVSFDGRTELRQLQLKWTLSQLKKELEKTFVHHPAKEILVYHDEQGFPGAELMRYPNRTLLRYRMYDGDRLIIQLKNTN